MLIPGLHIPVFPLKTIDIYMDGYYIDRDGGVWSTKGRSGSSPTKLMGSTTPSGRYYTLNKRTHRADDVFRRARQHKDFITETGNTVGALPETRTQDLAGVLPGRSKSARQAVAVKGYVLATLSPNDKLVFGTDPMFHLTEPTAKAEAERIASNTGAEVVMLKVVGKVKVQKAVWE